MNEEQFKKEICLLAGVEYYIDCEDCPKDALCSSKPKACGRIIHGEEITLEILIKAMVNYNLSEGKYLIADDVIYNEIEILAINPVRSIALNKYTNIKEFEIALTKALEYVIKNK